MSQAKPTIGGSSIGVRVAYGVTDSLVKANEIIAEVFYSILDKYTDKSYRMV